MKENVIKLSPEVLRHLVVSSVLRTYILQFSRSKKYLWVKQILKFLVLAVGIEVIIALSEITAYAMPIWAPHTTGNCTACHVHSELEQSKCPDCHEPTQGNKACVSCHTDKTSPNEFCWQCHIKDNNHLQVLEGSGVVPTCTFCHGQKHSFINDCNSCHQISIHEVHTSQADFLDTLANLDFSDCQECHSDKNEHSPAKIECSVCHPQKHQQDEGKTLDCSACHFNESHVEIDCADCHPGEDAGKEDHLPQHNISIKNLTCTECHVAETTHAGTWECTDCHAQVFHLTSPPTPDFSGCLLCHPSQKSANNCYDCHQVAGAHNLSKINRDFAECHTQQEHADRVTCQNCHKINHHDKKTSVYLDCVDCHSQRLHPQYANCQQCHREEIMHQAIPFTPDFNICLACHPTAKNAGSCAKCHNDMHHQTNPSVPDCQSCHVTRKKHDNVVECERCHTNNHHKKEFELLDCRNCHWQQLHASSISCTECHYSIHGRINIPTESLCSSCHRVNHASNNCLSCHSTLRIHDRITVNGLVIVIKIPERVASQLISLTLAHVFPSPAQKIEKLVTQPLVVTGADLLFPFVLVISLFVSRISIKWGLRTSQAGEPAKPKKTRNQSER